MGRIIRDRWLSIAALALLGAHAQAQTLQSLAEAYRDKPTAVRRAPLERYAKTHAADQNGALARFALGVVEYENRDYAAAAADLKVVQGKLPRIRDYVSYFLAAAETEAGRFTDAAADLAAARAWTAPTPLRARILVLAARLLVANGSADEAVRLLRNRYTELNQPDADLALAAAYEAAGSRDQAAICYQQVYFGYPSHPGAARAASALLTLKEAMGSAYPEPEPGQMLARAEKLLLERDFSHAREEYQRLAGKFDGTHRDLARVGLGAVDYQKGETPQACRYLKSLELPQSEADAQRLYYVAECARKAVDDAEMANAVSRLSRQYPDSNWRLKALVTAANRYLLENRPEDYVPLYRAAYTDFPTAASAPNSHWKVTWDAYVRRHKDAAALMREHLENYPWHTSAGAALYYLGRLAERNGEYGAARAYYTRLDQLLPNYYYATLARERLRDAKLSGATTLAGTAAYLDAIDFPARKREKYLVPSSATTMRMERSHQLRSAGFAEWADAELRLGARTDGQAPLLAIEVAHLAPSPHLAMRAIKSTAPDYLSMHFEQAPLKFWQYLFPMPYRTELMRMARQHNLDPFLLAGLIRQESEFDPKALSRSRAYGLTQVMPSTGRQLARQVGVRRFSKNLLFQPAVNLKFGTFYLRSMLDQWGGKWEETLASYNAGKSRTVDWVTWGTFEEPSEFVETIPFTETRDYVQAIMRNAAIYRQLYAGQPEPADDVKEAAQVKKPAGKTSSKKSVTRSHSRKTRSPRT